jgi:P-type Ca2+ transporter type 2C
VDQVRRDGAVVEVSVFDVVVGDVVWVEGGDRIPADGVLVQGHDVISNESSLTGKDGRDTGVSHS